MPLNQFAIQFRFVTDLSVVGNSEKKEKRFHVNTHKETILHKELKYAQTEVIATYLFSQIKLRTASAIRANLISVQTSCQGKMRNIG